MLHQIVWGPPPANSKMKLVVNYDQVLDVSHRNVWGAAAPSSKTKLVLNKEQELDMSNRTVRGAPDSQLPYKNCPFSGNFQVLRGNLSAT